MVTNTENDLQALTDRFSAACNRFGLVISQPKAEVMQQDNQAERLADIRQNNELLKNTNTFRCLSCIISSSRVDADINARIAKASSAFGSLRDNVWDNSKLTLCTKISVNIAVVFSTLYYGTEAWPRKETRKES